MRVVAVLAVANFFERVHTSHQKRSASAFYVTGIRDSDFGMRRCLWLNSADSTGTLPIRRLLFVVLDGPSGSHCLQ